MERRNKVVYSIFHFLDDFSEKNLRIKQRNLRKEMGKPIYLISANEETTYPIMTWAPSHVESALVSQVLCYANIVNGFKERIRRTLRPFLEVTAVYREEKTVEIAMHDDLKKLLNDKGYIFEVRPNIESSDPEEMIFCCPLDTKYVELIWDVLKITLMYVEKVKNDN